MKRRRLPAAIIVMAVLVVAACHAPVTVQTPAGKAAYTADQVVLRLQELQTATINAEAAGKMDRNTARLIVTFTVDAAQVLKATPGGWYPTVVKAWERVKQDVPAAAIPAVQTYWSAVDLMLAALAP